MRDPVKHKCIWLWNGLRRKFIESKNKFPFLIREVFRRKRKMRNKPPIAANAIVLGSGTGDLEN